MEATLAQLADLTGATVRGDPATALRNAAGIQHARAGEIALLASRKFGRFLASTAASALVVPSDFDPGLTTLPLLLADDPVAAFEAVVAHLCPPPPAPEPGVHPTAVVADDAALGEGVSIGAHCVVEAGAAIGPHTVLRPLAYVGREARLGAHCLLHPHAAVLERCVVGDRVGLHSGVVGGADRDRCDHRVGAHAKIPQRGIVELGDDVEIGANATVDRARFGRTVIGDGTKIDNLAMVAHNVVVGPHCLLVSQCGIAGSTTLGHHVTLAAQAGLVGHIQNGDGAVVTAQSGGTHSVPAGQVVFGSPAQDIHKERRSAVLHQKLPELLAQLRALQRTVEHLSRKVAQLESPTDHPPAAG